MKNQSLPARCAMIFLACVVLLPLGAADWPQWQGPDRTNVSTETGLLKEWPSGGPKLLWTLSDAGTGYSGPAIVGDRLYTMGAWDGKEWLFAVDTNTGAKVWSTEVGKLFVNGWGDGPRGTPTVNGGLVFAMGGQGNLLCVKAGNGERLWTKNMQKDLGGKMMSGWGYTESPLIDGEAVVCTPGGNQGTLAALDKNTGEVRWRSKDLKDNAAYSSLVVSEAGGIHQYVVMTDAGVSGVAAKDGRLLWRFPRRSNTAAIPTPIVSGDYVFATSGYDAGCVLLKLTADGDTIQCQKVYGEDEDYQRITNHHGGVVLVNGCLYGYSDGKHGRGPRRWLCQEFKSGKILWSEDRKLGKGSLTCADGQLYCYSESDGTVVLIAASPEGWQENGRFKIPQQTKLPRKGGHIWTHPVVANGRLYLRDQNLIFCYQVK
jgi:outer membrane protein assembly factor BamB